MRRILWVASPFVIGLAVSLLIDTFIHPEPVLVFRIGVGVLCLLFGLLASSVVTITLWGQLRGEQDASIQAEERRRSFLRRLDHEIKNPLTGLRAALANLSESASVPERERAAGNARRDVQRLTRLLADLRKLSDLDVRTMERLPVYVPNILEEIVEAASSLPAYQGRKVALLIANVPPLPFVTGDRDLLGLAFYNLVENALKYGGPGTEVEVRAREEGRSLLIEVADGGPGIPAEDLPHLFEELYRGANARGIEGSGLGLALTARIVELHGGSLRDTSRQGERHGTLFIIEFQAGRAA